MLNEEQIKTLRSYCVLHGVVYYDVEQEIVDHLASVIEEEQTLFPEKTFEKILEEKVDEFSKDWTTIEAEKKKTLRREFYKEFFKEFKSCFTIPKILITLSAVIFSVSIVYKVMTNGGIIIGFIYHIIYSFYSKKRKRLYNKMDEEKVCCLLVWDIYNRINSFYILFSLSAMFALILLVLFKAPFNPAFIKGMVYVYPLLVITVFSLESAFYKTLQKIRNNYPLAFQ